ncbi:glycosyltransferase family 2 protein [Chryseobacterium koreense]|uniref:glycosyltransferase family 2 protein n=1 Tax=Chryseobacterium koreense TaxID=232216 RepID=UPI001364BDB3|nr:glycosyltransferase family 2 protein [Chryseobacterium koreense]MBB5333544.1 glycosyltransferase involved in cell wall biosynthesis [Chryseobacterium koreense]
MSVIVPVYNVEQYLQQCIDSIVNQTFSDLEILLVDDGSTDGSLSICEGYAARDSRIRVIHQQNGGVSSARNTGIKQATGDYITFVDADDWLDKDMYLQMQKAVNIHPGVEVVMCDFINVQNNIEVKVSSHLPEGLYFKNDIIQDIYPTLLVTEDFGRLPIVSACTCLFNRTFLLNERIRFDVSLRYSEDYLFMAEVMVNANSFFYHKENFLYFYRQYEESRSKKYQNGWWQSLLLLNSKLKSLLADSAEFDFTRQLKLQLIHSSLFLSSAIFENENLSYKKKIVLLKQLFNDEALTTAFNNLVFDQQSFTLKIVLFLMKNRVAVSYLLYRKMISKIMNA